MSINAANSSAIQLAHQLLEQYEKDSPWLRQFEEETDTARERYTQENNEIDLRNEYPGIEYLESRYQNWSGVIENFKEKQIRVCLLATEMNQNLVRLRHCSIPSEVFAKLSFINHVEGPLLEQYYAYLRTKVSILEEHHKSIQKLATKALEEINLIEDHPHRRLLQTIGRVKTGQRNPSTISWATDKASRYASSAYASLIGRQTPHKSGSFSPTEPLPSQRSDESGDTPDLVPPLLIPPPPLTGNLLPAEDWPSLGAPPPAAAEKKDRKK